MICIFTISTYSSLFDLLLVDDLVFNSIKGVPLFLDSVTIKLGLSNDDHRSIFLFVLAIVSIFCCGLVHITYDYIGAYIRNLHYAFFL